MNQDNRNGEQEQTVSISLDDMNKTKDDAATSGDTDSEKSLMAKNLSKILDDDCDIYTVFGLLFIGKIRERLLMPGARNDSSKVPNLVFIVAKIILIFFLVLASFSLQVVLPFTALSWYDFSWDNVHAFDYGPERNTFEANFLWGLFFGSPYILVGLNSALSLYKNLRCSLAIFAGIDDGATNHMVAKIIIWLATVINTVSFFVIMVLAYANLTSESALTATDNVLSFPRIVDILKDVVALEYLLEADNMTFRFLVYGKYIRGAEALKEEGLLSAKRYSSLRFMYGESAEHSSFSAWLSVRPFDSKVLCLMTVFTRYLFMMLVPIVIAMAIILSQTTWQSDCATAGVFSSESYNASCEAMFGNDWEDIVS